MSSMSPPRPKSSRWLGKCWSISVSFLVIFPFLLSPLSYPCIAFYIFSMLLLMATSSSKGRNRTSTMSSSCLVQGRTLPRQSIKVILRTMSTNRRFVHFILLQYQLIIYNRLILASLAMMPQFVRPLDRHRVMQSLELWLLFAQDIAWYAEMGLAIFNKAKSMWL